MISTTGIALAPLLPWAVLWPLFGVGAAVLLAGLFRRARGMAWRVLVMAVLAAALLNPALVQEERDPIDDVAVILVDQSPSQAIGERTARTEAALASLEEELAAQDDLEVRVIRTELGADRSIEETRLIEALQAGTADVPRRRLAGTILLTDGQVHDVPGDPSALADMGPIHGLLSGERDEADRRISIAQAPSFGMVGEEVTVSLRVDDLPDPMAPGGRASVMVMVDGQPATRMDAPLGRPFDVVVPLQHGGPSVLEFEVEAAAEELTLSNNRVAVVINGVRDRLRVLLVSGEPHPGERTWRNILKSDPSVDLVHFTILRPPEKQDGTPINELSLISFPIRELFELRLSEFDLIIFDRYRRRGVLPTLYYANIADYVAAGGALLEASGEQFASTFSVFRTPLGAVLPGQPSGRVYEGGFLPAVTDLGLRHPVTAGLEGLGEEGAEAEWGRWFRQVEVLPVAGSVVMDGADGQPLLLLDRVGEGRVAQLTSDQIWLWSRGFEGGGPQAELLRRLAHWLMKEPELEENDLRTEVAGTRIRIERRSLDADVDSVEITTPSGETVTVPLQNLSPGRDVGTFVAEEPGIFRLSDGTMMALAVVGTANPPELADMRTTEERLAPLAAETGGGLHWLADGLPALRRVGPDRDATGRDWIGLRANGDYVVTGVRDTPLLPAALVLALALGTLMAAWHREGR